MSDATQSTDGYNRSAIFWICVLALVTAALSFSLRSGVAGAIQQGVFDPIDAARSGELVATALGNSFLGFAISLLAISPFLDVFGAKRIVLLASVCFIVGPALIIYAPNAGDGPAIVSMMNIGMVIAGVGWGATEASINPVTAALYPNDKTHRLNVLHAWWPAGIVAGGLTIVGSSQFLGGYDWRYIVAAIMVPGLLFGHWALTQKFPNTESTNLGVPC
jgi:MFS family permease